MKIRSITSASEIGSFRLRQTIQTRYRDMPGIDSTTTLSIEARRDPPAVQTTLSSDGQPTTVTLMIHDELWMRTGDGWSQSEIGAVPPNWTLNAYRELGDMSLVAPLTAQAVITAGQEVGPEVVDGAQLTRYSAGTSTVVRLLMEAFHDRQARANPADGGDSAPPASYIIQYQADFWVDPGTGFVIRERTLIEYTEERLHGQPAGTGPATFTTTREFYDFNAPVPLTRPM